MNAFARGFAVSALTLSLATPLAAQDLVFTVTNQSGVDLVELYASSSDASSWEENILAGQALPSGASGEVTIAGAGKNCAFDLRMVFADGDVLEDRTDICQAPGYTIN
jgi:hypothetical protein